MFFFNDTATTEIYTLSLHDALPICLDRLGQGGAVRAARLDRGEARVGEQLRPLDHAGAERLPVRSEEHTSELQSRQYIVCRLLLEKKKVQTSRGNEIVRAHSGPPAT